MRFTLVPMGCPVCGGDCPQAARPYRLVRRRTMPILRDLLETDLLIVACGNCGHHYLNPAPDEASFDAYYGDDYFMADDSSPANQQGSLSGADRFFFAAAGDRLPGTVASLTSAAETGNTSFGARGGVMRRRGLTAGTTLRWPVPNH
jgi:hypothetical protein